VRRFLDGLAQELNDGTYRPRHSGGPHPEVGQAGETRPLGIPTVRDRVVMAAAKIVLEPIFEADFSPVSFGFRPKRSAHQALEVVRQTANKGAVWVLDADIKSCFDEIDRDALVAQVERRVVDRRMVEAAQELAAGGGVRGRGRLRQWSRNPAGLTHLPLAGEHRPPRPRRGVGGIRAPARDPGALLRRLRRAVPHRGTGCSGPDLAQATLASLGLRLHPDKTRIACLRQGKEGFDFLGFHHRMRRSWKFPGRHYLNRWPSARAMASIRAKVKERTPRGYAGRELRYVVEDLNPVLRGWGAYFRYGNSDRKFAAIDSYVHERMAKLASVKHGRRGRNWSTRFTYGWLTDLGIYRLAGTVRYRDANALR